jgi:hypothetical protein
MWDLFDLPKWAVAIGCKWIYKIKRDTYSNVERNKARFVANNFIQKKCINYHETLSQKSLKNLRMIYLG